MDEATATNAAVRNLNMSDRLVTAAGIVGAAVLRIV
jgi:hypothetical protein